jgi:hypothetical protein
MSNVLIVDDIVKEYLPGYENVTRFMRLFHDYFVEQYNEGEFNYWLSKKFYTLIKYLRERLPEDLKTNHKRALSFVKNFKKLETYYNRSKNVKKPAAVENRERTKIKLITYWPFAKALEDRENLRISQEREAERKRADDEYKQYLLNDPEEKRKREVEEKENLEFWERINRQDEEKEKKHQKELRKRFRKVLDYTNVRSVFSFVRSNFIDSPEKFQKLFYDYISDIHPKIFNLDYHPDDFFIGSIDFRIDYPKLYKYLDKHLSVTEDEKVKLFKLFNRLDDKIQALISTNYDKLRFITLLPYYSVLVGREEKKRIKPRGNSTRVKKLSIDTFAKAARKFNSFFNFATNEMLGGIYNDYPQFLVLYSKYLKSFYTRSSSKTPTTLKLSYDKLYDFVIRWRYRDSIPGTQYFNVENYKFGKEYTDLVEFLKKFLKDTPKKGRKSLRNNVNSIADKLTLFHGQDMTGSRRDHFAFLALQLVVYAPFADAYSLPKLSRKNYALA